MTSFRLDYEAGITKIGVYVSKLDNEVPEGFRDFLETGARQGYERITAMLQADVESGKISVP